MLIHHLSLLYQQASCNSLHTQQLRKNFGFTLMAQLDFPQWKFSLFFMGIPPKGTAWPSDPKSKEAEAALWTYDGVLLELTQCVIQQQPQHMAVLPSLPFLTHSLILVLYTHLSLLCSNHGTETDADFKPYNNGNVEPHRGFGALTNNTHRRARVTQQCLPLCPRFTHTHTQDTLLS